MPTSVEITRRPEAPRSTGSRFLARDAGHPAPSQAAQYFQSARTAPPEAPAGAARDRYAAAAGRACARFSVQTAVAFALGALCAGGVAAVAFGS